MRCVRFQGSRVAFGSVAQWSGSREPDAVAQQLPAGPGADVLKSRCVICHEADIITSQKLSLTGWTNSINKMVRWGSQITPEEREVLQPYLAQHFAPKPAASHASTEAGAATYKRVCLDLPRRRYH